MALADLVLALVVALVGRSAKPGPEIELAFEVRKMALGSLQDNVKDLKHTTESVAGFFQHPLDAATDKLLVPLALSIVRGLRSKKD